MAADEITISEAVKLLENKYTGSYLLKLAKQGKITGRQSGSIWLVDWPSIEAYVAVDHPRGGSVKGWKKRQQNGASEPAQTAEAPATPAAAQETIIEAPSGAHIRIDALAPGKEFYEAEATEGDVKASILMRRYGTLASAWVQDKSYDRLDALAPGRMGLKQEQRGKALLKQLEQYMRQALQAAGWHTEDRAGNELWRQGAEG